ncbi:MAG: c-type cytochrome, partial [Rudanella sp.]|nr:c-type cytochrome [Rudanella sp.]
TAQLVPVNAPEAARIGADLLRSLPPQTDVSELFGAFLASKEGIRNLAAELTTRKIPENRAKTGRQILQRQVPYNQRNDESVKLLAKALEASGGVLPAEKMPQELSGQEISSLAKTIKETADPVKGELVFRKNSVACLTCHAIGGAGGRIGPDLSSLGTSSPAETIIRSILYPNQSIKEGYELQRVAKKDGSELMGYMVSNGTADVVLRDVAGQEISIPKSQISVIEKVPGSLMPSGLTAGLDREEFANLVAFLSKMGESGQFRVPTARFVRRWSAVSATKELVKKIREEGISYVVKDNANVPLQPLYGKVSGDLPLDELPTIDLSPAKRYSFVRFEIEVVSKGIVNLSLNTTNGITAWVGQKPIKLTSSGILADLPPGIHTITLALDRTALKDGTITSQLQDAVNSPAQTRLVMGR